MEPKIQSRVETFFQTFGAGREEAHRALWASAPTVSGALGETSGVGRLEPLRYFGDTPEVAALASFQGEGGHPSQEGILIFRFNEEGLLERLAAHWDPGSFLDAGGPPAPSDSLATKDPRVQVTLNSYFDSFNAGNEDEHYASAHPDMVFFGSLSRVQSQGLAASRGIFGAVRNSLGIRIITPKRYFGDWPEVSVLLALSRENGAGKVEAVFSFRFDDSGRVLGLSALWNPLPFLKRTENT